MREKTIIKDSCYDIVSQIDLGVYGLKESAAMLFFAIFLRDIKLPYE